MKKIILVSAIILLGWTASNGNLFAQTTPMSAPPPSMESKDSKSHMHHSNPFGIPGLTEDQISKIKDLHLQLARASQPIKNRLGELRAREKTLTTAENADIKAIEANIDEITKTENQLMKLKASNHQQIRAILTPDQRLAFDTHEHNKMRFSHEGAPWQNEDHKDKGEFQE